MTKKIPVAILGATGMVGQKFCELLQDHPWFEIVALAASHRSEGKRFYEASEWKMATALKSSLANMPLLSCQADVPAQLLFSGLDSSVAGEIETSYVAKGYTVVSNARNHRMDPDVPLLIADVNPDHLDLLKTQKGSGKLVTNPNCSVIGIATALKPLCDAFGVEKVHAVTLQAVSGAGYPGVSSFDIVDNVIPFIAGEEEKIESEPLKILGSVTQRHSMQLSAQCNRVACLDGHMACLSVKLGKKTTREEILDAWKSYHSVPHSLKLPTAPQHSILYLDDPKHPQPKLHRHLDNGMVVTIGRLRPCHLFDWKFTLLSHNTIRGAAGMAILNAELLVAKKLLKS
jgi:aspartate-semialdehyde dehydrogenase